MMLLLIQLLKQFAEKVGSNAHQFAFILAVFRKYIDEKIHLTFDILLIYITLFDIL